jgi:hypothetical protein
MRQSKSHPPIGKGKSDNVPFKVAAVSWIDLLGYGSMISRAQFNPIDPRAKVPIARLRGFHRIVAEHSGRYFRTLVLNDGAAAYRDLSFRTSSVTYDFLLRSFRLFQDIQAFERRNEYFGARMILAAGFRSKGSRRAIDYREGHLGSILDRMSKGEIDANQAVREAATIQAYFDVLPQLQANFAFTKAYLADLSGSDHGIGGPNFYVDSSLFEGGAPAWLSIDEEVKWNDPRLDLSATFFRVQEISIVPHNGPSPEGVRDALEVATAIAPSASVLDAIREGRREWVRNGGGARWRGGASQQ